VKEIPRLMHEVTVGVQLLVRVSDEERRLQECVRVRECSSARPDRRGFIRECRSVVT
jgi:hypothetical protein